MGCVRGIASSSSRQQLGVCRAFGQLNRPQQPLRLTRPQVPQQQQQVHQVDRPPQLPSNSGLSQGAGQLLAPPSRNVLTPQQQKRLAALLDDNDTRMAAYDGLEVQVTRAGVVSQLPAAEAASFNKGSCRIRPFMAAAMKAMHCQRPTPVQRAAFEAIDSGADVLCATPPGSGSSTGVLLALVRQLAVIYRSIPRSRAWPLALLLCPTRELALQSAAQAAQLAATSHLSVKCVTGGTPITQQALDMRRGADLLVATPGRLMDLLDQQKVTLRRLKYLVLEEVDELTGPGLLPITKQLLHHNSMPAQTQRQTIALGTSALPQQQLMAAAADALVPNATVIRATWPLKQQQQQQPQQEEQPVGQPLLQQQQQSLLLQRRRRRQTQQQQQQQQQLSGSAPLAALLSDPAAAMAAAAAATAAAIAPSVQHRFVGVAPQLKHRTLLRLLSGSTGDGGNTSGSGHGPAVVFTNSAAAADEVVTQLAAAGVAAGALHFARSQSQREEALQCFRFGVTQVLVACGVAYRGLDLPDVALVVNFDVPLSLAEYARRVGLAGRQGRPGASVMLVTPGDGPGVVPFVALLTAAGQAVPEWLAALSSGSSGGDGSSDGRGDEGSSGPAAAGGAAGLTAAADGSVAAAEASGVAAGRDQKPHQQQQQPPQLQVSGVFSVQQQQGGGQLQFGGYNRTKKGRKQQGAAPGGGNSSSNDKSTNSS